MKKLLIYIFITAVSLSLVSAQTSEEGGQSFQVRYTVQLIPQTTGMSCWAAAAAMVVGWRDQVSLTDEMISQGSGRLERYFRDRSGLPPDDNTMFEFWALTPMGGMSISPTILRDMLERYGPLWVKTEEGSPHARVITGIAGDGTPNGTMVYINDPWENGMTTFRSNNQGSRYTESFATFIRKYNTNASLDYQAGFIGNYMMAHP